MPIPHGVRWIDTVQGDARSGRCCWCDKEVSRRQKRRKRLLPNGATKEHLWPKSKGGGDHPSNLAVACYECNRRREDREGPPPLPEHKLKGWASVAWREGTRWIPLRFSEEVCEGRDNHHAPHARCNGEVSHGRAR